MAIYSNCILMTLLLFIPLVFSLFLKKKKMLTEEYVCCTIIMTGVMLRLTYILYTGIVDRQHDVHDFFSDNGGHAEYILYFFRYRSFPDFDPREIWQFYHPPLHHIICAVWLTILEFFGIPAKFDGVHTLPFLTVVYSSLFCLFACKTFKRLDFKSTTLYLCTAFVTFHPTLIILSGSVNNDMLSSLFGMMAVFYTVKWSQDRKWYSIVMIALSIGLGMFTKLSVGLLAPAVAVVFLVVLIKQRKEIKKLIPQFLVFAVICLPLGLFWSVRNYVKFDVPLNYVPKLSDDSFQFIEKSGLERFTDWSLYQISSPFVQWGGDTTYKEFNPIIALLKNSMFDEGTFFDRSITLQSFCTALFFVNIILVVFALVGLAVFLFKNKVQKIEIKLLLAVTGVVIFGNYCIFCVNYQHICTQNMRYCVPLIFVGAASLGYFVDKFKESKKSILKKSVPFVKGMMTAFCSLSIFVYMAMMYYITYLSTIL